MSGLSGTPGALWQALTQAQVTVLNIEVPYEHIIGTVNACKAVDIKNVEFVGNSKFKKYFSKGLTGGQ